MVDNLKNKKEVGLILNPYGEKNAAGLGRSIYSLAEAIIANTPDVLFIVYIKGFDTPDPKFKTENFKVKRLPNSIFWLDIGLWDEKKLDAYIFFTPVMPFFVKCSNSIVIVHDLAYRTIKSESFRDFFIRLLLRFVHGNALKRSERIISVSKYTKDEVVNYYPTVNPDKISVIHNGFNQIIRDLKEGVKIRIDKPYFLFVGVLKKRKNVLRLIEAFEEYKKEQNNDHCLVLAGKGGEREVEEKIKNSQFSSDIILTGYVSDSELYYLYSKTLAFVFPSLIEGFGMPILEAMSLGVPVITSNTGAMLEVAGDAAYLADPKSANSIAEGLRKIADNDLLRREFIRKGLERVKEFSWDKAAVGYCKFINNLS